MVDGGGPAAPPSGSITKSGSNYNLDFMSDPTFGLNLSLTNAKVTAVSSSPGHGCGVKSDGSMICTFPTKQTGGTVVFTTDKDPCTGPATLTTDSGSASVNCGGTPTPTTATPTTVKPPTPTPTPTPTPNPVTNPVNTNPSNPSGAGVIIGGNVETPGGHVAVEAGVAGDGILHISTSENGGGGRTVGVYLHSDPVLLGIAVLDSNGRASFVAPIPPGTPPGWHEIVVVDFLNGAFGSAPVFIGFTPGWIPGLPSWANAYAAPAFGWGTPIQTAPSWSYTPTWGSSYAPTWGSSNGDQQQQQQQTDSGSSQQQQQGSQQQQQQ